MKEFTSMALVEKIVRAKVKLEKAIIPHKSSCVVENDPEGFAPCDCGASSHNSEINSALAELKLD